MKFVSFIHLQFIIFVSWLVDKMSDSVSQERSNASQRKYEVS